MRDPSTHSVHTATMRASERASLFQEQTGGESQHRMRGTHALGRSPLSETQWHSPALPALFGAPPQAYATPAAPTQFVEPGYPPTASDFAAEYTPTAPSLPTYPAARPGLGMASASALPYSMPQMAMPPEPLVWLIATITPGGGTHYMEGAGRAGARESPVWAPPLHPSHPAAGGSWQRHE
jgi:hypothetical protein